MLPPPTISFTIPSIHDNVVLQCRVYHPTCLAPTTASHMTGWARKAAIVAHPYAVMGGSYDDPIVDIVACTILKQGFVVGTFNFRGAGKGKTSWTSQPERQDYLSFIGFMIYYLHHLSPPATLIRPLPACSDPEIHNLSPVPSQAVPPPNTSDPRYSAAASGNSTPNRPSAQINPSETKPLLLLAGYSYGALITASLPPIISSVISQFQNPTPGSAHAEIRMRADCLAIQQNELIKMQTDSLLQIELNLRGRGFHNGDVLVSPKLRKPGGGVRMGGEEDLRRASHDSYRSRHSFSLDTPEVVRKSVDRVRSIGKSKKPPHSPQRQNTQGSLASSQSNKASQNSIEQIALDEDVAKQSPKEIPGVGEGLRTAYLLVSPLHGLVNNLVTLWNSRSGKYAINENEAKLTVDPTLALFGDDDVFVSIKKLRSWADKLADTQKGEISRFRYTEVSGAGHFWHDHHSVRILQQEIKIFVQGL